CATNAMPLSMAFMAERISSRRRLPKPLIATRTAIVCLRSCEGRSPRCGRPAVPLLFLRASPSGGVAAGRGGGVVPGALQKGFLALADVLLLAGPGLQRRGLQGPAVGEAELPREPGQLVHGVQVLG